ncbi:Uncharacterised protein [Burkholderia pseudomallei]|nr:Uncharacterised protein [Burkholderia pseudomallei]
MAQTFIAVKTILPGDLFFPADAASALCRDRAREAPAGSGGLTDREPTVLRHSAGIRAGRFFRFIAENRGALENDCVT